jgi:hypothetical protein
VVIAHVLQFRGTAEQLANARTALGREVYAHLRELGATRGAFEATGGRRTALGQFDVALRAAPEER